MQDLGDRRGAWLYNAPSAFTRTKVADTNSGSRAARLCLGVTLLGVAGALFAQASGLTRTLVGKADVSVPGREAVVARVEVAAGAHAGRHTHPGDEISYVLDGQVELLIDGQPPRTVKAGESFVVPAGVIHDASNIISEPVRLVGG